MNQLRFAFAVCFGAVLAACSSTSGNSFSPVTSGTSESMIAAPPQSEARPRLPVGHHLYVANGGKSTVTVYAVDGRKVVRRISNVAPGALAFDPSGNLYIANKPKTHGGDVLVYARDSTRLLRTISQGIDAPGALAFDGQGNLYVTNASGRNITVYAPGSKQILRTISQGLKTPGALAFDNAGNLYVGNDHNIRIYGPRSNKVLRTISQGINEPAALRFDASGNLYVANFGNKTVTVYAPGSGSVARTISKGIKAPSDIAIDTSGNLYVANNTMPGGNVAVYYRDGLAPFKTIGADLPCALITDASGNLYVPNWGGGGPSKGNHGAVVIFGPAPQNKLLRGIVNGVYDPWALALGP